MNVLFLETNTTTPDKAQETPQYLAHLKLPFLPQEYPLVLLQSLRADPPLEHPPLQPDQALSLRVGPLHGLRLRHLILLGRDLWRVLLVAETRHKDLRDLVL